MKNFIPVLRRFFEVFDRRSVGIRINSRPSGSFSKQTIFDVILSAQNTAPDRIPSTLKIRNFTQQLKTYLDVIFLHIRKIRIIFFSLVAYTKLKFFRFTLNAFISIRMTLGTIQNDYFDYVSHVWDIFGTIRPLKIIFWYYIFKNFRLKINKNTLFDLLWLYKGN